MRFGIEMWMLGARNRLAKHFSSTPPISPDLGARRFSIAPYLIALRPQQWLKNILLLLPAIAAHRFDASILSILVIAFFSFGLCASSAYVVNDLVDLPHDRAHPEKRRRPLAAGTLPLSHGIILFFSLFVVSLALALTLNWKFVFVLVGYFCLSTGYSFYLKRKLMIDVVALAALYGARVIAGAAATEIVPSDWLVGFCVFTFLSLALVKRSTELLSSPETKSSKIGGRGYRSSDLPIVNAMMTASGFIAIMVLALYINSPEVKAIYQRPYLLWGICGILIYWLGRLFVLTTRGEMSHDPVSFTAVDRISLLAGALIIAIFIVAT